jgi:ABC-type phosphonate transport system ATPase subunit
MLTERAAGDKIVGAAGAGALAQLSAISVELAGTSGKVKPNSPTYERKPVLRFAPEFS